jgi:hypothetical protein
VSPDVVKRSCAYVIFYRRRPLHDVEQRRAQIIASVSAATAAAARAEAAAAAAAGQVRTPVSALDANNVVRVLRKTEFWLYFHTAQVWVPKMWLLWLQVQPPMFVTAGALVTLRAAPVVARALAAGAVRVPPRTGLCSGIISAAFATCDLLKYSILYCYRRALRCVRGHVPPRRFVIF